MYMNNGYYPQYTVQQNPAMLSQQMRLAQLEQQNPQIMQPQPMMYQPQMAQAQQGLNGRVIDDISTVNANEVSMDGSISIFPMRDMSEIYTKNWNSNGTIETVRYKRISSEDVNNSAPTEEKLKIGLSDDVLKAFDERFSQLNAKIEQLQKSITPKTTKTKKESED